MRLGTAIRWASLLPEGYRPALSSGISKFLGFHDTDTVLDLEYVLEGTDHVTKSMLRFIRNKGLVPRSNWSRFSITYDRCGPIVLCPTSSTTNRDMSSSQTTALQQAMHSIGLACELQLQLPHDLYALEKQLSRARLVVGVDTGSLHMADYMQIPVLSMHSTTAPYRTGPIGARSSSLVNVRGVNSIPIEHIVSTIQSMLTHSILQPLD